MGEMKKAFGKGPRKTPPFIHLSDVWAHYGSCEVPTTRGKRGEKAADGSPLKRCISFGNHLANQIEATEMLLFDVHDFKPILGLELNEVVHFLRGAGPKVADSIGMDKGRDYCLDGEKVMQMVGALKTKARSSGLSSEPNTSVSIVESSNSSPNVKDPINERTDLFGDEIGPVDVEILRLKLSEGRISAVREMKLRASGGPASKAAARTEARGLPTGAIALSNEYRILGEYEYFKNKFNRKGLPALWFDTTEIEWPFINESLTQRNALWQSSLDNMYKSHPEKTHGVLCKDLANMLNAQRARGAKEINSSTIRTNTFDPGNRGTGGSKPRSLR